MTKTTPLFLVPLLAALLAGCGAGRTAPGGGAVTDLFHSPMGRIAASIVAAKERVPGRKIVVYELSDISGRSIPEGKLVAERLTTRLARTGEFRVIERSRLEAAMKELNLSASGMIDAGTAARAGRVLGAEAVVTGTLTRVNGKFEINARAIDVQTGSIIAAAVEQVDEEDLRVTQAVPRAAETPAAPLFQAQRPYQPPQQQPVRLAGPGPARGLPAGWEEWPGWEGRYGSYLLRDGRLVYTLAGRQHDHRDTVHGDGYYPGLLLAREIKGDNWTVESKADYFMRPSGGRWLSLYLWVGDPKARPSILSKSSVFCLVARRQMDTGYGSDNFLVNPVPGETGIFDRDIRCLRFSRKGKRFEAYVSSDCSRFSRAYSGDLPAAAGAGSQKIVLGGQAFAETGSYAEFEYIKLNGKPLF